MQTIGNGFTLILFITCFGSVFFIMQVFARKVLHLPVHLWVGVAGMLLFVIPVAVPQVRLIPSEDTLWIGGYRTAFQLWAIGVLMVSLYLVLRSVCARLAIRRYPLCTDERLAAIYRECAANVGVKRLPPLRFGCLKDPACVTNTIRPQILLSEKVMRELSDKELAVVVTHELMHVKRKHHLLQSFYEIICCFHWCNPLAWISKKDFASLCEFDCDRKALFSLNDKATAADYAMAMLRLLELSRAKGSTANAIGALDFFLARRRFVQILNAPSNFKRKVSMNLYILLVLLTLFVSAMASRTYFSPYPALAGNEERSVESTYGR